MSTVIYRHTVEAFFERVLARKGLLEPAFVARLGTLGIDPKRLTDVDIATWWKLIAMVAEVMAPGQPSADAHRLVGREVVRGYEQSFVGKTTFMVLRMLGHRRAATRLAEALRSSDNATRIEVLDSSPHHARVRFSVDGGHPEPAYTEAVFQEGLLILGAKNPTVTYEREPAGTILYELKWA